MSLYGDEILLEFHDESRELLDQVVGDLLALEKRWDAEGVNRIYRAFHSIKGNSAMLGYTRLSALTHELESVLARVRDRTIQVDRALTRLLTDSVDVLNLVLDDLIAGGMDDRDCGELLEHLRLVLNTVGGQAAATRGGTPVRRAVSLPPEDPLSKPDKVTAGEFLPEDSERVPQKKILIAEDDFVSRQIMISVFGRLGVCHVAKDGIEAVTAFLAGFSDRGKSPYDLICVDIHMPRMDGLSTIKVLRGLERGTGLTEQDKEAVMVVVSAYENPRELARQTYEAGADLFFPKPLDVSQMARALARLGISLPVGGQGGGS